MGAVYGIIGEADRSELEALGNGLAHRGPASAQWSVSPLVHLGMRGTAAALEKVKGANIVFDGAIDNRAELSALVAGRPQSSLSSDDDATLLLQLSSTLGIEGFQQIAGQFACAIYDGSRVLLVRDRIGYAPLYFTMNRGRLIFASEYKALLGIKGVAARPNRHAIQVIQSTKWVLPGATCLEDVYPVAPGTWMAIEPGRIHTARFWDLPIRVVHENETQHVASLRSSFLETLGRQTAPYRRIGISLSGGLDSAVMAAGARAVAPDKELHTFSAGYGSDDRELVNAELVAKELGTTHHPLVLNPLDLSGLLPWMVWYMEEPIGREDIAYLFVAAREAAHYVDLVLTGFGFDGLFAGLPRHRVADVALRAPPLSGPLREFYDYTVRSIQPQGLGGRVLKQLYFRGKDFPAPQVCGADTLPRLTGFGGNGDQPLSGFLRKGFLVLPYQSTVERLYTAAGVRFNAHHTDPSFLATAFSIPDRLKIHGRSQKYVLRRACAGLLPESILKFGKSFNRLKHDLQMSAVLDELAEGLLSTSAVTDRGLFEPSYVEALRGRPANHPYSQERAYRLWSLLLSEMWCRMYLDHRGAPPTTPLPPVRRLAGEELTGQVNVATIPPTSGK
jgi:asparagine synthase (glutamine-hydrolysing)